MFKLLCGHLHTLLTQAVLVTSCTRLLCLQIHFTHPINSVFPPWQPGSRGQPLASDLWMASPSGIEGVDASSLGGKSRLLDHIQIQRWEARRDTSIFLLMTAAKRTVVECTTERTGGRLVQTVANIVSSWDQVVVLLNHFDWLTRTNWAEGRTSARCSGSPVVLPGLY